MANQTLAFGTTFSWNGNVVAGLKSIGGVELSIDALDGTTHQSASAGKEFFPGLVDAGDLTIEGFFDYADSAGQVAMVADAKARTVRTCVITFPAALGAVWAFNGFVTKIKPADSPSDGLIPFSATIKITGVPALTLATSAGLTTPFFTVNNSGVIAPAAAQNTLEYTINWLTGITTFTITPTAAAGVITITANGTSQTVTSGQASTAIALGAATSMINVTVVVQETNKAPKTYLLHCVRA